MTYQFECDNTEWKENFRTPTNTVSLESLGVLIRNHAMNDSVEFVNNCDEMQTDSPLRQPLATIEHVNKKLFHSPMFQSSPAKGQIVRPNLERTRKTQKRKQCLVPNSNERIRKVFVQEREQDGSSPNQCDGMRRTVLRSLFNNKEYSMDLCE